MWVGTQADLLRLLRLMEKRYEPLLESHSAQSTAHRREMLRIAQDRKTRSERAFSTSEPMAPNQIEQVEQIRADRSAEIEAEVEEMTQRLHEAEAKAAGAGRIDAVLIGKDNERRSVTGSASELVDYLDGRYIYEIEFSAPSGNILDHSISIRADRQDGIYLRISSVDSQWCIAGFSEIQDEIRKNTPLWQFVRNPIFLYVLFAIVSIVGLWHIGDTIALWTTETGNFSGETLQLANWLYYAGILATTLSIPPMVRRYVPAFEVVPPNSQARGRRVIAVLVTTFSTVILSVFSNVISSAILNAPNGGS